MQIPYVETMVLQQPPRASCRRAGAAGVVVTLAIAVAGLAVPHELAPFLGILVGSAVGGATAAYYSDRGLAKDVGTAIAANLASALVFFLVPAAVLLPVLLIDGQAAVAVVLYLSTYLLLGGLAAIAFTAITLSVAGISGAVASVATDRRAVTAVDDGPRS